MLALSSAVNAQSTKTITLKVFDGKTGLAVTPTGYQVRVDRQQELHNDWAKTNEDGTATLTVPESAHEIALHLAYDDSMEIYIGCDADKNVHGDVWYLVPQILTKALSRRIYAPSPR